MSGPFEDAKSVCPRLVEELLEVDNRNLFGEITIDREAPLGPGDYGKTVPGLYRGVSMLDHLRIGIFRPSCRGLCVLRLSGNQ